MFFCMMANSVANIQNLTFGDVWLFCTGELSSLLTVTVQNPQAVAHCESRPTASVLVALFCIQLSQRDLPA